MTSRHRWIVSAVAGLLMLSAAPGAGLAGRIQLEPVTYSLGSDSSLRGLTGLGVHAEQTSFGLWPFGITDEWLRDEAISALQVAGVSVLRTSDALASERQPLLLVRLQSQVVPRRGAFVWHLSLAVFERAATLGPSPDTTMAQVWAAPSTLGMTSGENLRGSLRESLGGLMAEFLRAWSRRNDTGAGRGATKPAP